jgi:uncharacterized repeat protein (TIGR03803 family)
MIEAWEHLDWRKRACGIAALCALMAIALPAQTFTTLHSFNGTDGYSPMGALVQATNGDLYGTTFYGGANCLPTGCGTVFKITPGGKATTVYNFCSESACADGASPYAGLVQAANGYLYGTTSSGTVFRMTPSGILTTLQSGLGQPAGALVQAVNGDLYGTTRGGGNTNTACSGGSCGTIFKMTPDGSTLTMVYSFCSQGTATVPCPDGANPFAGLVQAANGDFYGTTQFGGANCLPDGCGTVFKFTPSGTLTTLHSFCSKGSQSLMCTDGYNPVGGLVQASNGDFYGTTYWGPSTDSNAGAGTVFRITPGGSLKTIYNFCSQQGPMAPCADGDNPYAGLIQGTNGNLFGTTLGGGTSTANNGGTVFEITPAGSLTTLYNFCTQTDCTDGMNPFAGLYQDTNGDFYGTTQIGGTNNTCGGTVQEPGCGTVFRVSLDLPPFVKTLPPAGLVGEAVRILGTDLTGATSVSFNGTPAVFTVVSSAEITTTVPAGATTGTVEVVAPSGTLSSNLPFRVLP